MPDVAVGRGPEAVWHWDGHWARSGETWFSFPFCHDFLYMDVLSLLGTAELWGPRVHPGQHALLAGKEPETLGRR